MRYRPTPSTIAKIFEWRDSGGLSWREIQTLLRASGVPVKTHSTPMRWYDKADKEGFSFCGEPAPVAYRKIRRSAA